MPDLDSLDRTELIRLIQELQRQNEQLRKQVEQLRRQQHRSAAPFSKGKRKQNPKKPGRKPGQGEFRRRSEPATAPSSPPVDVPVEQPNVLFVADDWNRKVWKTFRQRTSRPGRSPW